MAGLVDKDRDDLRNITFAAFVKDADSEEELGRYLKTGTLTDTRVGRGDIDAAIAWLQKAGRSPQRLLVDIAGSSAPLDELDRLANACEPSVQVYVVGDRNDVGLYRNLLMRGVQDYLVKPLNAELLRRALDDSDSGAVRKGRHGKAIAVMGTRGGVGATSIAAHLARDLAAGGARRRVVYMDLNAHDGCGASLLGMAGGNALAEVIGNVSRLDPQYLERTLATTDNRLYVLASELAYADEFVPAPGVLGDVLDTLCQYFHYVVIDVPSCGSALANEAIAHAGLACVVADLSVHSARTLVRMVRHIEARPHPPTVYSVLNQTQPSLQGRVLPKDFLAAVELPVQVQIGYDPKTTALAENLGEPLAGQGPFAAGVRTLSSLVTGEAVRQGKTVWWQRVLHRVPA
ncbi:AAA family ATPase [Alcaligenaceae bacterium SJ-26]|nr:AAA family ATPase [Alcaligenaceae bacterium SJ-26]